MVETTTLAERWFVPDNAYNTFNQCFQFQDGSHPSHPLQRRDKSIVTLQSIAPTVSAHEDDTSRASKGLEAVIDASHEILSADWVNEEDWQVKLESWLRFWSDRRIAVDMDRVLRYAIRCNRPEIVDYLLSRTTANVRSRDTFGMSALFYAVSMDMPTKVLWQVVQAIGGQADLKRELKHEDIHGLTAMYYAAESPAVQNLESLLALWPPNDAARAALAEKTFTTLQWPGVPMTGSLFVLLLFGKMHKWLNFPVYCEHVVPKKKRPQIWRGALTLEDLHTQTIAERTVLSTEFYSDRSPDSLIWLHMPWTNGVLLEALYTIIRKHVHSRKSSVDLPIELEICRRLWQQSFLTTAIAPGNPYLTYRPPTCEIFDSLSPIGLASVDDEDIPQKNRLRSSRIVLPVITLESLDTFIKIRAEHIKLCQPFKEEYGFTSERIQSERTLDEAHYPSLSPKVLDEYNFDQVTTRECTKTIGGKPVVGNERPILMVSQLWIWRFGNYMLSASSVQGTTPDELLFERGNPYFHDSNGADEQSSDVAFKALAEEGDKEREAWTGTESRIRGPEADIQIGSLLAMQVEKFGKLQANGTFQAPLDYFEIGVARVMADVNEYTRSTNTETLDIKKEEKFLHDLSDIRGELMTVDEILIQQQEIFDEFVAGAEPSASSRTFFGRVTNAQKLLAGYRKRVAKIDRDAERIDTMINGALDLKRTHASIQDARASLQDARSSLLLGWAVMGFTVITVIFAPIAFMTALFALPIDGLIKNQKNGTDAAGEPLSMYTSGYVTWTFFVAEIGALIITALAIWAALRLRDWIKPTPVEKEKAIPAEKFKTSAEGAVCSSSRHDKVRGMGSLKRRRKEAGDLSKEEV